MALELYDSFARVEATGLGVSDSGHTWTTALSSNFSVDGDAGLVSLAANTTLYRATVDSSNEEDVDVAVAFLLNPSFVEGDSLSFTLTARESGGNYVYGRVLVAPSGATTLYIDNSGGVASGVVGPTWDGETRLNVRFSIVGNSAHLKTWFGEGTEPVNWNTSKTITTANTTGLVGFGVSLGALATVTLPYEIGVDDAVISTVILDDGVTDTFTRSVAAGGWGQSDTDHTWTIVGTGSQFSVNGSRGVISLLADGSLQGATTDTAISDFRLRGDFGLTAVPTTDTYAGLVGRYTDSNNYIWCRLAWASSGALVGEAVVRVAGVETGHSWTILTGASAPQDYVAGTMYTVVGELTGSSLKMKAWVAGTTEPLAWNLEHTIASLPAGDKPAGVLTKRAVLAGSATVHVDNINIRNVFPKVEVDVVDDLDSPYVRVTIINGDVYDLVRVERVHINNTIQPAAVRGLDGVEVPALALANDYEVPLDEEFIYKMYALDSEGRVVSVGESDPVILEVPYHRVILRSVGQPTLSTRIQITSFPSFSQSLRVLQEAKVLGRRNSAVLFDVMEGITGSFSFMTLLDQDPVGYRIRTLFEEGQPLLFQSVSRVTGIKDFYLIARSVQSDRKTVLRASEAPRYIYTLEFQEVERPSTAEETLSFFTWQTLLDAGHADWQSVADSFSTWLSVLSFTDRDPV